MPTVRVWMSSSLMPTALSASTTSRISRALAALASCALRDQLFTEDGDLNRFVNVYLNGQDVRYLEGTGTPVGERDEVRLLPAMAGG